MATAFNLANEAVKVYTRRGNDWTNRFKKVADDAWHISAGSAIIDGENSGTGRLWHDGFLGAAK
jgi:ATP-dependent DNA ligase